MRNSIFYVGLTAGRFSPRGPLGICGARELVDDHAALENTAGRQGCDTEDKVGLVVIYASGRTGARYFDKREVDQRKREFEALPTIVNVEVSPIHRP